MKEVIEANYKIVKERTADVIIAEIRTIEAEVTQTVIAGAIKIGQRLEEAKEKVGHGNFERWCEENLSYSKTKAERFMKIASEYGKGNSVYFDAISKTAISTDLSIYKALALLKVDEEDVKEFTENHDVNDMTVKELEEEIRKLKAENEDAGKLKEKIEKLENELEIAEEIKADLQRRYNRDTEAISKDNRAEIENNYAEIAELQKKLEKAKAKVKKLQEEKENIELEKEADIEQAKEEAAANAEEKAKEMAKAEVQAELNKLNAELDEALKKASEAEKKLSLNNNEDITVFKIKTDQLQKTVIEIKEAIDNIEVTDEARAEGMKVALKKLLSMLLEKI